MTLTRWELVALAWAVRVLGAAALALLLAFAAWWLVMGAVRVAGKWQWLRDLSWMWFVESRSDPAKFRRAVEKWSAWEHDKERERAVEAETKRLRWYYQQREVYLRKVYAADEMPDDTEPAVGDDGLGTDGRDDIV